MTDVETMPQWAPRLFCTVVKECGYEEARLGLSFNKNQDAEKIDDLMIRLSKMDGGHNKNLESIIVWIDVIGPRYWWQEADTFRLSTKQSQSTMHTILKNELTQANFEYEVPVEYLAALNSRLKEGDLNRLKAMLPEGFLQRRLWCMSYKTLRNVILQRRNHRLPHWHVFVKEVLRQVKHPELLPKYKEES